MQNAHEDPSFERVLKALRRAAWSGGKEGRAWISGRDTGGAYLVQIETPEGERFTLGVPDTSVLEMLIGPPLKPPREAPVPYRPRTAAALPRKPAPTPVSVIRGGATAQAMTAIDVLSAPQIEVAGFTCRGPTREAQGVEYKPYNEDALLMRLVPAQAGRPAVALLAAFDQAGGEGRVEGSHGAASDAAARAFDEAARRIEAGEDPEAVLREAAEDADRAVRRLGVGAVSTLAGAAILAWPDGPARAVIVNVGDSRVILTGPDGRIKRKSRLHNLGASIAAGEVASVPPALALRFAAALSRGLGGENATPDVESWELAPGDRLIVASDGLGDAHEMEETPLGHWHGERCAVAVSRVAGAAARAEDAVDALVGYALDQVADGYGKPDNLTVGVAFLR